MRVHNVRLGFACNSSSTHSILIFPKGSELPPEDIHDAGTWGYGWGNFTLTSPEEKALYTWSQMARATTPALADLIMMGANIKMPKGVAYDDGLSVDHQSQLFLPGEWDGSMPSVEYAQDLARFMNQPNAVILGGNDNSDGHPLVQAAFGGDDRAREIEWQHEQSNRRSVLRRTPDGRLFAYTDNLGGEPSYIGGSVCRKDGSLWTIFSRRSGNRMTVTFDDSPLPERLEAPMLVDIKVTDYCTMGCPFCYQGSTTEGQHADKDYVHGLLYQLSKMKCFEVAFGGGEPTEHPDFADFVTTAHDYHIMPNVTSRNPAWFMAKKNQKAVKSLGAIAFSAETLTQLRKWEPFIKARQESDDRWNLPDLTVQVIDGAVTEAQLRNIAGYAFENDMRVTVLGWKTTGRADQFKKRDQGKWLDWYKGLDPWRRLKVAVDTVIVQQYGEQFKEMGVASESYIDAEGRWSCYVDGVTQTMAPSSYGQLSEARPLRRIWGDDIVKDVFRSLP